MVPTSLGRLPKHKDPTSSMVWGIWYRVYSRWYTVVYSTYMENSDLQTTVSGIPLFWASEPEYAILLCMWSLGPYSEVDTRYSQACIAWFQVESPIGLL